MIDERLQTSFWLSEFLRSDTAVRKGIDNTPAPEVLNNLRNVLAPGLQRVRNLLRVPMQITSGYRGPALNAAVGGARDSQHLLGLAADFVAPEFGLPVTIASYLLQHAPELRFDQLIQEGTWVHISFVPGVPRGDVLTAHFVDGHATYSRGLT